MSEEFISEPIKTVTAARSTAKMSIGEPGVPDEFVWRGEKFKVKGIVRTWKKASPCSHGSGEMYVRRHYYEILTDSDEKMKIYFDRQAPRGKPTAPRWWLLSREKVGGEIR